MNRRVGVAGVAVAAVAAAAGLLQCGGPAEKGRTTVSLDGTWQIADSVEAEQIPAAFEHSGPVPGLANLATPAFPDVDQFDSREVISNRIRRGRLPAAAMVSDAGVPRQERNYFWYQTRFLTPERKQVAILKINKAQFGTAVWLNGNKIGEHLGCFTAGYFNLTEAINWESENQLLVRIGAHPGVLPEGFPAGTDFEKNRWTPGIYDSVALLLSDNPVIESVQVAPRIATSEIVVETRVKNYGGSAQSFELGQRVTTWKDGAQAGGASGERHELGPGEEKTWQQTVRIPEARLWTPEDPFLYLLETSTGGDSVSTRFGMREFRFDTATKRAYLNGKVYFLRGSNITLHRFFEDPKAGNLAWDEVWVRKLLVEIPEKMNWNTFRFCIGPVPDRWLEIADEAGLLIQNEFFIWTGHPSWSGLYQREWNSDALLAQYKDWLRDNWNHPSVVIWDANNESYDPVFADKIIPEVRELDLSNRPWENSYNPAVGPDDPVEDHPYLFIRGALLPGEPFRMTDLERMAPWRPGINTPSGHATINNEYGWLWLNRDGTPTELTGKVYGNLLGPKATAQERFALNGYLLGGLTEYWRAHRNYAGVLHFVYLTSCYPGAYTCDHFQDVAALRLEPHFEDYVGEAFKPLGVYIHFWQPTLEAGSERSFTVMMINDDAEGVAGKLVVSLEAEDGTAVARSERPFELPALGQQTYLVPLTIPGQKGKVLLRATATAEPGRPAGPTVSRRKVEIVAKSR